MRYLILVIAILFNLTLHAQTVFSEKPSWEDSFDGRKVDQTLWNINKRLGGSKRVYYTGDNKRNVYVKRGKLNIVIRKENVDGAITTSAYLSSRREFKCGKFEFRVRCSNLAGLWPTIWMRGYKSYPIGGEIDILEYISCMGKTNFQANFHVWRKGVKSSEQHAKKIPIDITKLHTYTFEWLPNEMRILVDGTLYHSLKKSEVKDWPFNNDGYHFDVTVGTGGWAESCGTAYDRLPAKMQVDWVKYYDYIGK